MGFININKKTGESSAKTVSAVKKVFKVPCGHMGTLDPMASGVLPVGLYKTSRLFQYLLDKEKTYVAEFTFGVETDTLDTTGRVIRETAVVPTESQIKKALDKFVGEIEQVPPKYSAKNVDGKRGYALARKGVEFTLCPKLVCVKDFSLIEKTGENSYLFKIDCKGGTYIRSLARDLGEEVGSLAVMSKLTRTKCGIFSLENSVTTDELLSSDNPQKYVIASDEAVDFEKLFISEKIATDILNGVYNDYGYKDGLYRVYSDSFIGVGEAKDGVLRIKSYV